MPKDNPGPSRKAQKVHGGLGKHFTSPQKRRTNKRKTKTTESFAVNQRQAGIQARLAALEREEEERLLEEKHCAQHEPQLGQTGDERTNAHKAETPEDVEMFWEHEPANPEEGRVDRECRATETEDKKRSKRLIPDQFSEALFAKWDLLIPELIEPYLQYTRATFGMAWERCSSDIRSRCAKLDCTERKYQLIGLLFASGWP
jgi:hypothetical protein